jgi:primosomal protein N' (replication factor Y) (superfamily II helicase)
VVTEVPPLPDDLLKLAHFVAQYYVARLGDVLRMIVPTPMRRKVLRHYHLTDSGRSLLEQEPEHPIAAIRRTRVASSLRTKLRVSAKEMEALLAEWQTAGFISVKEKLSIGGEDVDEKAAEHTVSPFTPRHEQATALVALNAAQDSNAFKGFLLWGVTGSGKTEVYLATIAHALARGRTAVVLVPEIGLTPQLESRFRSRFGDDVVTIHSGLTSKQRRAAWTRVQAGAARVVVGPRSALFAPLDNIGVIIVDEEHDDSYKQDETPRYHARDVALVRAQMCGAICVLGSATPSLETLHNSKVGKLTSLVMKERASGGALPTVELVKIAERNDPDTPRRREQRTGHNIDLFTPRLTQLVAETLARKEQVILFLNRRGFAPFVICQGCGEGMKCENCSVSLTHHLSRGILLCHYCDHQEPIPLACPKCQSPGLRIVGSGTERLESELARVFPASRIGRLDRDIATHPKIMEETLTAFREGRLDILVGTQMVTKGHDFPMVTLVGVLMADSGLNFPDFRAAERTAQLLVQVAGRSGRADKPGRVVVQTFHPDHPALKAAQSHEYGRFAEEELLDREALHYPPASRLILLRLEDEDQAVVTQAAEMLATALNEEGVTVLGPAPCPLARLKGEWRMMILLKDAKSQRMKAHLRSVLQATSLPASTKLVIDVDPVSML